MREILFRGKRIDNEEWIEGSLILTNVVQTKPYIVDSCWCPYKKVNDKGYADFDWIDAYEVDPKTIGQFTGLTDKNGKQIFEGDIVKTHYANANNAEFIERVVFHNGRFCSLHQKGAMKMWANLPDCVPHLPQDKSVYMEWCEYIGNIHDNPELLED